MDNRFPGNSNSEVTPPKAKAEKKIERVTESEVVIRKKPLGRKMREFVVGDDSKSIVRYIWSDVLVPGAKDMVYDALTTGMERKLFGDSRPSRRHRAGLAGSFGNAAFTQYNRFSQGTTLRNQAPAQGLPNRRGRARLKDLDEIIFEDRVSAMAVLDQMISVMSQYESVSVADVWDMIGRTGEPTDENWGWVELQGADVIKVHEGYLLDLPAPTSLD